MWDDGGKTELVDFSVYSLIIAEETEKLGFQILCKIKVN